MKNRLFYRYVAVIETSLQKSIIDFIVDKFGINPADILILDLCNSSISKRFHFTINGDEFYVNLNTPLGIISSIKSIHRLRQCRIECEVLFSTFFFGFSTQYLSNVIHSKNCILIDDGVGNYTFIKKRLVCYADFNSNLKRLIVKLCLTIWCRRKPIEWSDIKEYYSIYNFGKQYFEKFVFLDLWSKFYKNTSIHNYTAFIGSPLLEFGQFNKKEYTELLRKLKFLFPNFVYFPHPDEKWFFDVDEVNELINSRDLNAESYFKTVGLPKVVIGFTSTVLLNMSYVPGVKVYFVRGDTHYLAYLIEDELFKIRGIEECFV